MMPPRPATMTARDVRWNGCSGRQISGCDAPNDSDDSCETRFNLRLVKTRKPNQCGTRDGSQSAMTKLATVLVAGIVASNEFEQPQIGGSQMQLMGTPHWQPIPDQPTDLGFCKCHKELIRTCLQIPDCDLLPSSREKARFLRSSVSTPFPAMKMDEWVWKLWKKHQQTSSCSGSQR